MTPREPDRFDAQARELVAQHYGPALSRESVPWIAAALRAEHASALERAAQGFDELASMSVDLDSDAAARQIRALIPPAAAPAADYDPITAPIPEGDMNGPHGPPAAEPRLGTCRAGGSHAGNKPHREWTSCKQWTPRPAAETGKAQGADLLAALRIAYEMGYRDHEVARDRNPNRVARNPDFAELLAAAPPEGEGK